MAAPRPSMATLFTAVFALGGWRSGLGPLGDNSFFWHLRTGERILEEGIPRADPYSFTAPGTDWVAQSWLVEAIYGILDRMAGPVGIRLLVAGTGAVVAAASYRLALRLAGDRLRAAGIAIVAVGASFTLWSARPLFAGLVALVGLLWMVEVPDSAIGRRAVIFLPVLMWLWANSHGTFILGFAYLGLHLAGRWLDGNPPWAGRERRLVKALTIAIGACLLNPYGPALLLFPFELFARGEVLRNVVEWNSPDFRSVQGVMLAVWVVLFLAIVGTSRQRLSKRDVVVTVPFLLLAFWAQRNVAIAPLVGLPVVARLVRTSRVRPESAARIQQPVAVLLLVLALAWTVEGIVGPDFEFDRFPVEAMEFVEAEGLLGKRLMTDDAWAGYVILRLWPEQKVFVDDRYDMYPISILEDYDDFASGGRNWKGVLDRYRIDVVVWGRGSAVSQLLEASPDWRSIHQDERAVVYVRQ